MAKPKFELTADLVKVEPEPTTEETVKPQQKKEEEPQEQPITAYAQKQEYRPSAPTAQPQPMNRYERVSNEQYFPQPRNFMQPAPQYAMQEPKEEEREAISMKIPKDLKKAFHLWCVQRGITMTEAIESAIKKFLQE